MALTYTTYCNTMRDMLQYPLNANDATFELIIPRMIEYAELRLYRELDFLTTRGASTGTMTAANRNLTTPTGVIIVESVNLVTPYTQTSPDAGTRNPLQRMSVDYINTVWGGQATGQPVCYALLSDTSVLFGPIPNHDYTAEFIGISRPAPLSPANTSTFLTANAPDIFIAASMIFGAGYQQNFGSQSDNPQLAQSWENQYQMLKTGVVIEEFRRKAASVEWTSYSPTPAANQPRDRSAAQQINA